MNVKLNVERNIASCCNKNATRWALGAVALTSSPGGQVWATSTNGKCLAFSRVSGVIDAPCFMPNEAVPKGSRGGEVVGNDEWKTTTGVNVKKTMVTQPLDSELRYPACDKIVINSQSDGYNAICINADLLALIAKSISDNGDIVIEVNSADSPLRVRGEHGGGVLMPLAADAIDEFDSFDDLANCYTS